MAGDERKDKGWKISHILLKYLSVQHIRQKEQTQTNRLKQLNIKMALEGSAAASFHSQDQSLCQTTSLRHKQGWTLLFHGTERSLLERRCSAQTHNGKAEPKAVVLVKHTSAGLKSQC